MKLPVEQQITFLPVQDIERTARFYEEALGLPLALDQTDCRIYRVCSGAYIGFCQRDTSPGYYPSVILTLVSLAVDAWYEHLLGRDVTIEKPPTMNEKYQIYHLLARDPDGYIIEIQEFRDPNWQE